MKTLSSHCVCAHLSAPTLERPYSIYETHSSNKEDKTSSCAYGFACYVNHRHMLNRNVRPDALSRCRIAYSVGAGPNISVRGRLPTVTARQWVTESKARSENAFDQRDAAAHHQRHLTVLSAIVRVRVYECGRTGGVLYEGLRSPTEVASGSPGPHPQAVQPVFTTSFLLSGPLLLLVTVHLLHMYTHSQ